MAKKAEIEQTVIEAPYELPEGWKWCRLGEVADWGSGGTPSRKNPEYYNGSIPWIKTGELNESYIFDSEEKISEEAINHSSAKLFPKETVVLAMYGATIGKTAIFGIDASTNQACACAICHKDLDNHYLFNFLKSKKDYFIYNAKGGAQPNISQEIIKDTVIPLPPTLAEQQRIVNRIESMFTKLDEAKEKGQNVVDSFETRKASILHKAFTGELTANWRKENGVADESWEEKTIGECFTHTTGKALKKDNQNGTPREYITTSNLYWDRFDFSEIRTMYFTDDELEKCTAKKGDLLLCNGGDVGRAAIWNFDYDICLQNHVSKLRNKGNVETRFFLYYFMLSKIKGNVNGKGIGISSLSAKDLLAMSINLPTIPEQQEIVRILDSVLEKESRAKEAAQTVLDQIALLKKTILARAFRGEL